MNISRRGKKVVSCLLSLGLAGSIGSFDVEAANARDLIYISLPIESSSAGADLEEKVKADPSKYFVLKNGGNDFEGNFLTASNWANILDTTMPSNYLTLADPNGSYWNGYFRDNLDKLEFEVIDSGERVCQHYAAYRVLGLGPLVQSGRWDSDRNNCFNGDYSYRYPPCAIGAGGGDVYAPKDDIIGFSGPGQIKFTIREFEDGWNGGGDGWGDSWGMWVAQERAISYTSAQWVDGKLMYYGAGSALCNYIDDNYNKYLPWLVGYPTNDGQCNDYCAVGCIALAFEKNVEGAWEWIPNATEVKLGGEVIPVSYTWCTDCGESVNCNLKISGLGTDYSTCWWNVYGWSSGGWVSHPCGTGYKAPDMNRQQWWTNPAQGCSGIHLNSATASLVGDDACRYHTGSAHVDIDNAYFGENSYNVTTGDWSHSVHFYSLKVYMKNDRTVTYLPNGGTGTVAATTEMIGTNILIKPNGFSKTGYKFDTARGWNTKTGGNGVIYSVNTYYTGDEDLTLYAIWRANQYNVYVFVNKPNTASSGIQYCK